MNAFADVRWVHAQIHWQHPRRGLLDPAKFMALAEDTGMAVPIGRFALEHALVEFGSWRTYKPDMRLSLALSARQLRDPSLASLLSGAIRAAEVDPGAICLEVPEGAVGEDPEAVTATLRRLKATGVRLALRDFGSGVASFSCLRQLPIDLIKIHEGFVKALGESDEDASIVGALVELGHALGLGVIADGVDTEAQLEQLRKLGCDGAQGDLIGHPMTGEQAQALLVAEIARVDVA